MKKYLATLVLGCALFSTPMLAQEEAHKSGEPAESGEKHGGMEVWKWANFVILAGVLGYLISKNVGPLLANRSQQIREGLAAGEKAKADADARAAAVTAKLAGLGQAVVQMKSAAQEDREREAARLRRDTAAELARIQQNGLLEIESAGKLARLELQRHAAKLAIELAEQKVRARMTTDVQSALLLNFLGEMASKGSQVSKEG